MKKLLEFPPTILKKIIITATIGPACFIFSLIYFLYTHDKIFLCISLILMCACVIKAVLLFKAVYKNNYYELNGVCVRISDKPFSKYKKIRLLDDNLIETEIMLKKDSKIFIGCRYRFYLMNTSEMQASDYLTTAMNYDNLLGYENLGEA